MAMALEYIWFWILIIAFIILILAIILDATLTDGLVAPWWVWLLVGIALVLALIALIWYLYDTRYCGKRHTITVVTVREDANGVPQLSQPVASYPPGYLALLDVK